MRLIQAIVWRVICVGLLAAGVAAFYLDLSTAYTVLASRLPDNTALRWSLGVALILVALIGLIPWPKRSRDSRKIAFKGAHGNVSIQLDSVEQTLNRAARKISEAKRINARITPSDNARNVHIQADVTLRKPANVSARDVEAKVSEFIVDQTKRILGEETAVTADLNIVDIVIEDKCGAARRNAGQEGSGVRGEILAPRNRELPRARPWKPSKRKLRPSRTGPRFPRRCLNPSMTRTKTRRKMSNRPARRTKTPRPGRTRKTRIRSGEFPAGPRPGAVARNVQADRMGRRAGDLQRNGACAILRPHKATVGTGSPQTPGEGTMSSHPTHLWRWRWCAHS